MKKTIISVLCMICILPIICSAELCDSNVAVNESCIIATPTLYCGSYTYDVIAENGTIVRDDQSMTLLNNSVYVFEFNASEGGYIIDLCDGSTKQVKVTSTIEDDISTLVTDRTTEYEIYLYWVCFLLAFVFLILSANFQKFFAIFSGFMFTVIALNLYLNGYPGLDNDFLKNIVSIICAGIGFYFILAPTLTEWEGWK